MIQRFDENKLESLYFDEEADGLKLVESLPLQSDTKSDFGEFVFQELASGKFYKTIVQRAGSYATDFTYYFDTDCEEVELTEVTVKKWMEVKQ